MSTGTLSSAKSSGLFAKDRKNLVRLLTIASLSIGAITASIFAYQQVTKSTALNLISKDEAVQIAIKEGGWNAQTLTDKMITASLLHIKQNGFSLVVDQGTLQDTLTTGGDPFPQYENQYLWKIEFVGSGNTVNGYWLSVINAKTGEVLIQS